MEYSGDGERGTRFRSSRKGGEGRCGVVVGGNCGRRGGQEREIEE